MLASKKLNKAPHSPGIYFFHARGGKILYIGKAKNLRMRLSSYADREVLSPAKQRMIKEATKITWREHDSEVEALIEEALAIKKYKPPYNVVFRDDKQYSFVGFTKDRFPRIFTTHQKNKNSKYLGPFTDAGALKTVLINLRKVFPYCTCKDAHKRPCVRAEIGKCLEFCCLKNSDPSAPQITRYRKNIRTIENILQGKKKNVLKMLIKEMGEFSRQQKFEEARAARDKITALENVFRHSSVIKRELDPERQKALELLKEILDLKNTPGRIEGYDISNIQGKDAVGSMVVFKNGLPQKSDYRLFKIRFQKTPNDVAMIQEVLLRRLRHEEWPFPDLFLIDGGAGQLSGAKKVLELYKKKTPVAALAKREEELWTGPKVKIPLKRFPPPILHLLGHIRDEAHRFALSFHRKRRRGTLLTHQ